MTIIFELLDGTTREKDGDEQTIMAEWAGFWEAPAAVAVTRRVVVEMQTKKRAVR